MYDFLLSPEERALRDELKEFAREQISSDYLRKMDRNEIDYPREFVNQLAERNLLGIRFPRQWGGRGMSWVAEVAALEEIGCLGIANKGNFSLSHSSFSDKQVCCGIRFDPKAKSLFEE